MSNEQHAQEIVMLRAEIEMLMSERQALLRATGAAVRMERDQAVEQ